MDATPRTALAEVPVGRTDRVDVGGRQLHVWLAGRTGPAVLLVHGIPTSSRLWLDVVPGLQDRARVVAVDLLGYGLSDDPDGWPVDVASQASYLLALLDALGLDEVVVVGHDIGGGVAQLLALSSPERVRGLCVVNGVCYDAWPVPAVRAVKAAWPVVQHLPSATLGAALRAGLRTLFAHRGKADRFVPQLVAPWQVPDGPRRLAGHLRSLDSVYTQAVAPFLPRFDVPAEVVWGQRDHQLKPRYGERLARDIPGARLTRVDDASHFVPGDRPDVVVEAVRRLLDRHEERPGHR